MERLILMMLLTTLNLATELRLDELKDSLFANHILLKAAEQKTKAADHQADSAGRRPDPFIKFGLFPKEVETRNGAMKTKIGVSQALPPRSRLHFKKRVAQGVASIQELNKTKLFQDLLLMLEKKFFMYNFMFKKRDVLDENLKLLNSWIKLWGTHYSHHNFQYQRLIQLQVDAREIEDQIRSVNEAIPIIYEELMELAWTTPSQAVKPVFKQAISNTDLTLKLKNNIELLLLDEALKKQTAKTNLAKSFFKPKYMLGTEWTQIDSDRPGATQGEDAWMISLGMELVLDKNRVRNRVSSENLKKQAILSKREYKRRDLEVKWKRFSFELDNARKQYLLIKDDLLPRTREALDSIQARYTTQSKGMDFFSLLGHLRKLLKLSLAMEVHYKDYFQARAEQKRILGNIEEN